MWQGREGKRKAASPCSPCSFPPLLPPALPSRSRRLPSGKGAQERRPQPRRHPDRGFVFIKHTSELIRSKRLVRMAHCVWVSVWAQEGEESSPRASGWLQYQQGPDGGRKINRGCVWDRAEREEKKVGETQAGRRPRSGWGLGAQDGVASGGKVPWGWLRLRARVGISCLSKTTTTQRKGEEFRLANCISCSRAIQEHFGGSVKVRGGFKCSLMAENNNETFTISPPPKWPQFAKQV